MTQEEQEENEQPTNVCPHLGLVGDSSAHRLFATASHRCYFGSKPERITRDHQIAFCLSEEHVDCYRLPDAEGRSSDRDAAVAFPPGRNRVLGAIAVASAVLIAIALLWDWLLPVQTMAESGRGARAQQPPGAATTPSGLFQGAPARAASPTLAAPMSQAPTSHVAGPSSASSSPGAVATASVSPSVPATPLRTPTVSPGIAGAGITPGVSSPTPVATMSGARTYVVKEGDTLWGVATLFGVTVEQIMRANGLEDRGSISVGQRLIIP